VRFTLFFFGHMPITEALPHEWYDTPNIHQCTIKDFLRMCAKLDIRIERAISLDQAGNSKPITSVPFANLLGEQGLFLLSKR
jgi:methionine biosynthesis protein MetW